LARGRRQTRNEIALVRAAGGAVIDVAADEAARQAMGPNVADRSRINDALAAGLRQASVVAAAIRSRWIGSPS
jgi:hypothetical protein